jgi:membrane protease YdiL (CAAX protease family)
MHDTDDPQEQSREDPSALDRQQMVMLGAVLEGSLAPLALVIGWALRQPPLAGFSWNPRDAALGALATVPMLAFFLATIRWPIGPLARIKQFFAAEVQPVLGARPWTDLALISLAAGVGEEMLFRGVFQGAFGRWFGPIGGLIAASALFGALHPITPTYIVLAGLLGAYLGGVWLVTGNLLTVIVAHTLYDFVALLVLLREPKSSSTSEPTAQ